MEPVVEIIDLRKVYGSVVGVDGISLCVKRGEVFGVLGPNGAGKTTTVECAAGLRRPDSGTVRVLGLDPASDPDTVRQRVGVQLQHAVLPNRMKVREAMAVFASAYRGHADPEGHRQANAALYRTVIVRMQHHELTRATLLGTPANDEQAKIICCLKRFLA